MRTRAWRGTIAAAVGLLTIGALVGCGGSGGSSSGRSATVDFVIRWPESASRVIPAGTNRFVIFVNGEGMATQAFIIDQTTSSGTTTYRYRVNVPEGAKRLFSAAAKQLSSASGKGAKYATLTQVPLDSPDLQEGLLLGAGIDPQPYDITATSRVVTTVEIKLPATPPSGISGITGRVNQVLTPSFPSIALLQMVRDDQGNPITDLNIANLEILEDGVPAVITDVRTVTQAGQPINVCLVLDRSGSMGFQGNQDLETAATTFVSLMQPDDAGEVINFSSTVRVDQPFTTDKSLLLAAIQGRSASGSTALWAAAMQGVEDTGAQGGRMAVLVMTDGYDNSSGGITQSMVVDRANQLGVPCFTIGLGGSVDPSLPLLADGTGGLHFNAPTSADLNDLYQKISGQLAGQLQVSFISPDPKQYSPPKTRQLQVRIQYGSFTQTVSGSYSM